MQPDLHHDTAPDDAEAGHGADALTGRGRLIGLSGGAVGFAGVLAAPVLAATPSWAQYGAGLVLVGAGLATLIRARTSARATHLGAALVALALALVLAPWLAAMPDPARRTLAVTVLMAAWWISVAVPIPATSLLPLVLFPLLGVMSTADTAKNYANNNIFLFLGGFVLALGIQRWGLHRRIALHIVRAVGTNPARMVLGFMIASAFLSMWISNTATTLMMLPIALAVAAALRDGDLGGGSSSVDDAAAAAGPGLGTFAPALLLGVAYAASIGGLATPIGTPPNISFLRILEILYPDAPKISFGRWLVAFLPLVVVLLPAAWLVLTRIAHRVPRVSIQAGREVIRDALAKLGHMGSGERRMAIVFATTALLWITRGDLDLGAVRIPGWAGALERALGEPFQAKYLHDATVAMAMALATFLIPGASANEPARRRPLMDWDTAKNLPWGILLLFGGGFALALAFKHSGLSEHLGTAFAGVVSGAPPAILVVAVCLLLTFLTEVTSNTATTEVMLPVLAGAAGAMEVNPLLLMLPATLSASCAFMLPIATPPNAIVFGSGEIEMRDMVRAGLWLNVIAVAIVATGFYLVSSWLLGVDLSQAPGWS
ncbi:SLC13 family permease [Haliangium sp.]|uniref:SLC13 family permease n=1 Tax=Haliangium sp. TaxID=2663208 RepID=UPI003D127C3E